MTQTIPRDRAYFEARTEKTETGCWEWKLFSARPGHGRGGKYGHCRDPRTNRPIGTHRLAYRELVGEIPEGYEIDHLCNNTLCCNPEHLRAVTPSENNQRKWDVGRGANQNTAKDVCPTHGTAYDMTNKRRDGRAFRSCRACYRDYQREYQRGVRARRKAAKE